jgi:NDP-sugar pyrophosphorylase family protein
MSLPVAILAGGLATRLWPLTHQTPKSLLEVAGKPFVEHQVNLLVENGFNELVFCVGYLGHLIEDYLGDGSRFGIQIRYSYDGEKPLGTGGALLNARSLLGKAFFVLYGDSYLDCDYVQIESCFRSQTKAGLMTVYRNEGQWDKSNVIFEAGEIICYDKKNSAPEMQFIDYGLSILTSQALASYPMDQAFDLSTVFQALIRKRQMLGFEVFQRFYEIGSLSGLKETENYLVQKMTGKKHE